MWLWISKGGFMMVPIMLCSVFSVAIIAERILFYFSILRLDTQTLLAKIFDCVRKNKISEAVDICDKTPFYVTNVLKAGLVYHESSREAVREAMDSAALYEIPKLEKNLSFLNMISQICPLLGLLGTALALLTGFYVLQEKALSVGAVSQADLAIGLGQALVVTIGGLAVALIASISYSYFIHRVNFYILETERAMSELLETLSQRRYDSEV